MLVKVFLEEGLGNSSYLVGSPEAGIAAVVDPVRDVEPYLQTAQALGLRIAYALETHSHNDFISGCRELAAQTGAEVCASAQACLQFPHRPLAEGDEIGLGRFRLRVLETPGHTPEHISFLAVDEQGQPQALFSGGALLVGAVARTDLLGEELSENLARALFHTLQEKVLPLPETVVLYPTHGGGSFCGAITLSNERTSTIGREKEQNPFLRFTDPEEFTRFALSGLPPVPAFYRRLRPINIRGPQVLGGLPMPPPRFPHQVHERLGQVLVLDVRPAIAFDEGHIPGAHNIPLEASFILWAGWLLPATAQLLLVADGQEQIRAAVRKLIAVALDEYDGYLEGGMEAWRQAGLPLARVSRLTAAELARALAEGESWTILDVRHPSEWAAGHIPGALHIPLGELSQRLDELPRDRPLAVHCAAGFRAGAAAGILEARGFPSVHHVIDGFEDLLKAGLPLAT